VKKTKKKGKDRKQLTKSSKITYCIGPFCLLRRRFLLLLKAQAFSFAAQFLTLKQVISLSSPTTDHQSIFITNYHNLKTKTVDHFTI
jgi:hypothetical protein